MVRPLVSADMNGPRGMRLAAVLALLVAALLLPGLVNRMPILYSDSVGYFHSGYAALEHVKALLDAHRGGGHVPGARLLGEQPHNTIGTARSVYYGIPFVAAYWAGGMWAVALAQVLVTAAALILAARHALDGSLRSQGFLLGIALVTGLSVFAVTAMPDLAAGLMLLGVAVILAYAPALSLLEFGFWLITILAAVLFHKAHLAILAAVVAVAACFLWRTRARALLLLAAVALAGLIAHAAVDFAVARLTGKPPASPPFLLARMVGDGTAEPYLRAACPSRHFATCAYLSRMPMRENDFLWSRDPVRSVMATAPAPTRDAIAAEANTIVIGAMERDPLGVAGAAIANAFRQFADVGVSEFALVPRDDVVPIRFLNYAMDRYQKSAIASGRMPLAGISLLMRAVYFAALLGAAALMLSRRRAPPKLTFVLILFLGLVVNAAVSGAISGVFDRYQGRVAWLAAFALAALWAAPRREDNV